MMARPWALPPEQIQWLVEYPDYPVFVIVEAFEAKFGKKLSKKYVLDLRNRLRGTSNKNSTRGPGRGLPEKEHQKRIIDEFVKWLDLK